MSDFKPDSKAPILVELSAATGVRKTGLKPTDITKQSKQAIDGAMNSIHNMADRVIDAIESLVKPPSVVEVSFGIKFDAETGAIIAKAGVEAGINVKLKWQNSEK
jgi:hypothetical protein